MLIRVWARLQETGKKWWFLLYGCEQQTLPGSYLPLSHMTSYYTLGGVCEHPVRGAQSGWLLMENQYQRVIYSTHKHSQGRPYGCQARAIHHCREWWGLQMIPGPEWSHATSPAPAPTSALHYAHYRPNQIKVMYGSNAMDFPSTYGLSLSSMTQERGPTEAPKLERLVHLSTQDGKGHSLKELTTNVRLENGARTLTRLCRFLFIFPHCKFWSRRAIRQNPCSNIIIRLTSAIRPEPNSIDWWP